MRHKPEVKVTLTPELYARLLSEATALDVPLAWLVASLVVDTFPEEAIQPARA
jgi:hypothetical protein